MDLLRVTRSPPVSLGKDLWRNRIVQGKIIL